MNVHGHDLCSVIVRSDHFSPRVKRGEQIILSSGVIAEEGDIVAVGTAKTETPKLAFYSEGIPYFATHVMTILSSSRLRQINEKQA